MKTIKTTYMRKAAMVLMISFLCMSFFGEKPKEVIIKTNSECGMCKSRIEEKLNYTKGIVYCELDIPSKNLTVRYKESKINLASIKSILSELGYDADDVKANPESQKKLPACCKPGGMDNKNKQ